MAKRKSTTRRTKTSARKAPRKKAGPGPLKRWWAALDEEGRNRVVRRLVRTTVLALVAGAVLVGMRLLGDRVMSGPAWAESAAQVELAEKPAWMSEMLAREICADIQLRQGADSRTFDADLARRVYEAALLCPWFRQVGDVRVERVKADGDDVLYGGGVVRIHATYRTPTAVACSGADRRVVDDQGVVLPDEQARALPGADRLPQIVGLALASPPVGMRWEGADLTAGLAMVKLLADKPYFNEIVAVDVTNTHRRGSLTDPAIVLVAEAAGRVTKVRFGELPLDGRPPVGEPSLERKLGYLDGWYRRNRLRLAGPTYLDLRYRDKIVFPAAYVAGS